MTLFHTLCPPPPPRNVRRILRVVGWNLLFILAGLLLVGIAGEVYFRVIGRLGDIIIDTGSASAYWRFEPGVGLLRPPHMELTLSNRMDYWTVQRANSLGFLDREPIGPARAAESCHISIIGDSFVEAKEVPISDKLQVRLEEIAAREAPHLDVTTSAFGIQRTGQVNHLAFYDRYARGMSPDMVILVFVPNDLADNSIGRYALRPGYVPERLPYGQAALDEDGNIRWLPPAVDFSNTVFTRAAEYLNSWRNRAIYRAAGASYLMRWLGFKTKLINVNDSVYKRFRPSADSARRYTEWTRLMEDRGVMFDKWFFTNFAFDQFKRRADSHGFALMVLAIHHVGGEGNPMFERLSATAESLGIQVVSQHDYIVRQGGNIVDAHFPNDGHWTPTGHLWAAEAVWEHIEKKHDGECPTLDTHVEVAVERASLGGLPDEDGDEYIPHVFDESSRSWDRFHTSVGEARVQVFPEFDLEGYRSVYESLTRHSPAVRSGWDMHIYADGLTYVKESCSVYDRDLPFFLHVFPADEGVLTGISRSWGFDDLDFYFGLRGVTFDGICMVSVDLPEYEIKGISTGQVADGAEIWRADYNFALPDIMDAVNEFLHSERDPVVRSNFDVYMDDGRLLYVKDSCNAEDRDLPFFLHVFPADENDLTDGRAESGFDNLGFELTDRGGVHGGDCFAAVDLPDYEISSIRTGQIADGVETWSAHYNFALPDIMDALNEFLQSERDPVVRSNFDVYMDDGRLLYVKDSCNAEDRDLPFFLHVFPADEKDLPVGREESGFDNLDFELIYKGGVHDDGCFAAVDLPEYDIAGVRTGQWVRGEGSVWEASIEFGE